MNRKNKILFAIFAMTNLVGIIYLSMLKFLPTNVVNYYFLFVLLFAYSIILVQILVLRGSEKMILAELIILNVTLLSIFQLPFSVFQGQDAHANYVVLNQIITNSSIPSYSSILSFAQWPALHILGASLFFVSGIDASSIALILPFIIEFFVPVFLFYTFKRILVTNSIASVQIAALGTLVFISTFDQMDFGSMFVSQTIAVLFLVIILFLYYSARFYVVKSSSYILLIILIIALTISHHFTSFMLIVFFSMVTVLNNKITLGLKIFLISVVAIIAYWAFFAPTPLFSFYSFIVSVFHQSYKTNISPANLVTYGTLRSYIISYGFFIFNGLFLVIMLIKRSAFAKFREMFFFLLFCGAMGAVGLFITSLGILPDRLISFGWITGSLVLIASIYYVKNSKIQKILIILVIGYLVFNLYEISPSYYSNPSQITEPFQQDLHVLSTLHFQSLPTNAFTFESTTAAFFQNYGIYPTTSIDNLQTAYSILEKNPLNYTTIIIDERVIASSPPDLGLTNFNNYTQTVLKNTYYNKVWGSTDLTVYLRTS